MSNATLARIVPQVTTLVESFFAPLDLFASHPVITITNDRAIIHVFYYTHTADTYINVNTINSLGEMLSSVLNTSVELRFVKVTYPYMDAYILAQYISKELVLVKWNVVQRRLIASILPIKSIYDDNIVNGSTYITGVKVSLSGRLMNETSLPRQTTKSFSIGSFKDHRQSLLTQGKYTAVNLKGAYTVNVTISQRLSSPVV